jgi:DNA-binding CsgD family transcriptional regulator
MSGRAAKFADKDLPALLAQLFASLLDDEPWSAFLDSLAAASGANWVTLMLAPKEAGQPGLFLTPGGDFAVGADYQTRLFAIDPFTGLPDGQVCHFRDFVSEGVLAQNAAYHEFIQQIGTDETLGLDIAGTARLQLRLRLTRAPDARKFDQADAERLQSIEPHLRVALAIFERLAAVETEQFIYASAAAQIAVGTIILDRVGNVLRINAPASAFLERKDGVALRRNAVVLAAPGLQRQLQAFLAGPPDHNQITLRISRPSGAPDFLLVAGHVAGPNYVVAAGGPAVVLFITSPAAASRIPVDAVRERLGLTPAEAAVAAHLAEGVSLTDAASRLGVSRNTVRAHLRAIFAKTGVQRQGQLVHLVHRSLIGFTV